MPHYAKFLAAPRYHEGASLRKGKVGSLSRAAFCVPQLLVSSLVQPCRPLSLRRTLSLASHIGWKPPLASMIPRKNSSLCNSKEAIMPGGPGSYLSRSTEQSPSELLGTGSLGEITLCPPDCCFWAGRRGRWGLESGTGSARATQAAVLANPGLVLLAPLHPVSHCLSAKVGSPLHITSYSQSWASTWSLQWSPELPSAPLSVVLSLPTIISLHGNHQRPLRVTHWVLHRPQSPVPSKH